MRKGKPFRLSNRVEAREVTSLAKAVCGRCRGTGIDPQDRGKCPDCGKVLWLLPRRAWIRE